MLGSGYWKSQGAEIIAQVDAAHEIEEQGERILASARRRLRDKAYGTVLTAPDRTFTDTLTLDLGGLKVEIINLGPAHSPGDAVVWIPTHKTVISGDMAFHERMLPVFEHTDTAAWIKSWDKFEALGAAHVIPGHGRPTTIGEVTKYTRDYLVHMRREVQKVLDAGGGLIDAYKIDQSVYEHLDTYEFLARQNAGRIYRAMEFE